MCEPCGALDSAYRPRTARNGAIAALVVWLAIACNACGTDIHGRVLPDRREQVRVPWHRIEVRLVRGNVLAALKARIQKRQHDARVEALLRVVDEAKLEQAQQNDELAKVRDALNGRKLSEDFQTSLSGGDIGHACLAVTARQLAEKRREFAEAVAVTAVRLGLADYLSSNLHEVVERLRSNLDEACGREARRLHEEFVRHSLPQRSWTVLASGQGTDRLCWSVENTGAVAAAFSGLRLVYNSHLLPPEVAAGIWGIPEPESVLRIPNSRGVNNRDLLPGERYEVCFYARRSRLSAHLLEPYGFGPVPTRGGEWQVRWEDVRLGGSTPADRSAGPDGGANPPLNKVFSAALKRYEDGLPATELLQLLEDSLPGRQVEQAQTMLVLCHRIIELEKEQAETAALIEAAEEDRENDLLLESRLRPAIRARMQEPELRSRWSREGLALLESMTVAKRQHALGDTYRFESIPGGDYTVVAESIDVAGRSPRLWIISVRVDSSVEQDIVLGASHEGTLRAFIEKTIW